MCVFLYFFYLSLNRYQHINVNVTRCCNGDSPVPVNNAGSKKKSNIISTLFNDLPFHFQVAFYVSIIINYDRSRNEILNIIYVNTVIPGVLKQV